MNIVSRPAPTLSRLLAIGLFSACSWAQATSPCDLNGDRTVNQTDAQLAVNMSLGSTPCTANIMGANVCNVAVVQRVINAATGGACITASSHSAGLTWAASVSANIAGYRIYRGSATGGPYTLLTPSLVSGVSYADASVVAGQTYFYVVTAVDTSGSASAYSNEARAAIPTP